MSVAEAARVPPDGRRLAARMADAGATSYKAYEHLTRAELGGLIGGAHERGLTVTGHVCSVTFAEAADLDIDNLEHGIWVATDFVGDNQPDTCPPSDVAMGAVPSANQLAVRKLIHKLVGARVAVTSTLPVFETFLSTREPATETAIDLMSPKSRKRYLSARSNVWSRRASHPSKRSRKRADLIVVQGNPEELITDIRRVETVFKDGVGYDPARLMDSVRGIVGTGQCADVC